MVINASLIVSFAMSGSRSRAAISGATVDFPLAGGPDTTTKRSALTTECCLPRAVRARKLEALAALGALAAQEIRVNALNPGPVDTGWANGELYESIRQRFPSGRWTTPGEIAGVVRWLLSPDSAVVTGQVINAEAGFRRW